MDTKHCLECGNVNLNVAKFCISCGTQIAHTSNSSSVPSKKIFSKKTPQQIIFDTTIGENIKAGTTDDESDLDGIDIDKAVSSIDQDFVEGFFNLVAAHGIEPKKPVKMQDVVNTSKEKRKSSSNKRGGQAISAKEILDSTKNTRQKE